jgi:hypothetical protein
MQFAQALRILLVTAGCVSCTPIPAPEPVAAEPSVQRNKDEAEAGLPINPSTNTANAQMQFHLAYMRPWAGAVPATFSNDHSFKFVSAEPLIRAEELTSAQAFLSDGQATVEIGISAGAQDKFNDLVARNIEAQDRGAFEDHVALAVMVDGKPTQVIQGVFQPLTERKLWWAPADDRLPAAEQLRISEEMARRIAHPSPNP